MPTPETTILDEDAVSKIEARAPVSSYSTGVHKPQLRVLLSPAERDALCATVKHLRAEKDRAHEEIDYASKLANTKADELKQEIQRSFRFKQERDDLQSQLEQLRAELAQAYTDNERLALVLQGIEERETVKLKTEDAPRAGNPWTGNEP